MKKSHLLGAVCIHLIFLVISGGPLAADYTFKAIVITDMSDQPYRHPSINDNGTVVFNSPGEIFTGAGGALTNITAMLDDDFRLVGDPSINNDGTVAFIAESKSSYYHAIFTGSGGPLTTIIDTTGEFDYFDLIMSSNNPQPSINNNGTIAFWAGHDTNSADFYTIKSGAVESFYVRGATNRAPDINDSGTVVMFTEDGYSNPAIWTGTNGLVTKIVDKSTFPSEWDLYGVYDASINNSGTVVFSTIFNTTTTTQPWTGIYTSNGRPPKTVADNSNRLDNDGLSFSFIHSPSISDKGTVVFIGERNYGKQGIYTGPDPVKDAVIEVGDRLLGSIVTELSFAQYSEHTKQAINRYGQIAFIADMADGRKGIFVATPVTVDLSGTIKTSDGEDVCAMVLASGQYMFSCNPIGDFSLTNLPRQSDGTVKHQIYADGFFPKIDVLTGSGDDDVIMTRSGACPNYNTSYDPAFVPDSTGKQIYIAGKVLTQDGQTPICAMVLANGQHMFSCDGTGSYALKIPLDSSGQFKLQVYADGFAPTIQTFDEFKTTNNVRMARAAECQ